MRIPVHTLILAAALAAQPMFATANAGAPAPEAAAPAATAAPASMDVSAEHRDPEPPEAKPALNPAASNLLLALIAYGMRHARR